MLFICPMVLMAQSISGTIYDAETTIKGVKIFNETQNKVDFSDASGNFKIEASLGDQLSIISLFHEPLTVKVEASYFELPIVFELKKITNELDEVQLMNVVEKNFDSVQINTEVQLQLKNDIKNRPYLYEPAPSGNMDFNKIGALIASLFKKKQYSSEISYLKPEDLQSLFASDSFFTTKMLSEEFNISEDYQFLFFEFCSAQQIDMFLISEAKSLELLELLMAYSKNFKKILVENSKD